MAAQYLVTLTIEDDNFSMPSTWPEVSIAVHTPVSIILEGTEEELCGRVISIRRVQQQEEKR
jgi:hypothetical protein